MTDTAAGNYHPNEKDGTCGQYLGTGFILGGEYTKRGELPYQAVLGYRNRRGKIKYNCGGTMINRYVCSICSVIWPNYCTFYFLALKDHFENETWGFFFVYLQKPIISLHTLIF